jgi:hypothetical protein
MKLLITLFILSSATAFATENNNDKICKTLWNKAIHNCEVATCKDWVKDEGKPVNQKTIAECFANSDGDLLEGAQICAADGGELATLVKAHNLKNPKNKVNCDDM